MVICEQTQLLFYLLILATAGTRQKNPLILLLGLGLGSLGRYPGLGSLGGPPSLGSHGGHPGFISLGGPQSLGSLSGHPWLGVRPGHRPAPRHHQLYTKSYGRSQMSSGVPSRAEPWCSSRHASMHGSFMDLPSLLASHNNICLSKLLRDKKILSVRLSQLDLRAMTVISSLKLRIMEAVEEVGVENMFMDKEILTSLIKDITRSRGMVHSNSFVGARGRRKCGRRAPALYLPNLGSVLLASLLVSEVFLVAALSSSLAISSSTSRP